MLHIYIKMQLVVIKDDSIQYHKESRKMQKEKMYLDIFHAIKNRKILFV